MLTELLILKYCTVLNMNFKTKISAFIRFSSYKYMKPLLQNSRNPHNHTSSVDKIRA